jgi:Rieske Fe-S protein
MEVDMSEAGHEHGLSRRSFVTGVVGFLGSIIAAVIGIPAIGYLISPGLKVESADEWVPLGLFEDIPIGEPKLFSFTRTKRVGWETTASSYGIYVIRHEDDSVDLLSNVCTHLSCRVAWNSDVQEFDCPCHDAAFAIDGTVISGPPPRPMDKFEHRIEEDGTLMVHLVEG